LHWCTPSSTYQVELVETPAGPCTAGTLTTDAQGNGAVYLSAPEAAGTSDAFVFMVGTGPFDGVDLAATPDVIFR
jgi:hypothetical protein